MGWKYEGFKVGDVIRAYDFEPRPEIGDRYVEGVIIDGSLRGNEEAPFAYYKIAVDRDTAFPDEPRIIVYVPMETTFDWEGRVVRIIADLDEARVGDGATYVIHTDRLAGTVIDRTAKSITVREDDTKLLNGANSGAPDALKFYSGGFAGHFAGTHRYRVKANPSGAIRKLSLIHI